MAFPRAGVVKLIALLTLIGASSGCVSTNAGSPGSRGPDLSGYSTYSWLPITRTGPGSRIDPANLAHEDIQRAVAIQLDNAGLRKVAPGQGDLLAQYRLVRGDRFAGGDLRDPYAGMSSPFGDDPSRFFPSGFGLSSESTFTEQGALVVELIDAPSSQLVWRGSARIALDPSFGSFRDQAAIHRAVQEIFLDFPR